MEDVIKALDLHVGRLEEINDADRARLGTKKAEILIEFAMLNQQLATLTGVLKRGDQLTALMGEEIVKVIRLQALQGSVRELLGGELPKFPEGKLVVDAAAREVVEFANSRMKHHDDMLKDVSGALRKDLDK